MTLRRPTDRQIVSHLLAFFAGLAVAYFAIPALKMPVHTVEQASSFQQFPSVDAQPPQFGSRSSKLTGPPPPTPADLNGHLIIPVQGITKSQLIDTYTQSRSEDRLHNAIDIMAPEGTPVLAASTGYVEKLHESAAGGTTIYVFNAERTYSFYYAHLSAYAPGLHERQLVQQGEVIGYVGHTGNASPDGPHLHFQVSALTQDASWGGGESVNPYPILMNAPR